MELKLKNLKELRLIYNLIRVGQKLIQNMLESNAIRWICLVIPMNYVYKRRLLMS